MNRRVLLCVAIAGFAMSAPAQGESSTTEKAAAARPNILFCIADDWSWPHASAYGDPVVKTPVFDRIARDGVLFTNAFCASPSCTPSRAGILTGQAIHRLREGANLHGFLPAEFAVYPKLLEQSDYRVGHSGKAWGPGRFKRGGRERNPAGPRFRSFEAFLADVDETPFCFWLGSSDPHRPYKKGSGVAAGMKLADVRVPGFLPDTDIVRSDILDYYVEVQRFDALVGRAVDLLEEQGRLSNTLVIVTSDNGMPFPRAKATLYDGGTRMPLAIMWKERIQGARRSRAFTSATDIAPTILQAAGLTPPRSMTGRSLLPLLEAKDESGRARVFLERERHAHVRVDNLGYPSRAIRTEAFLLIWNLRPDRWPSGNPEHVFSVGAYGDVDNSPTKAVILAKRDRFFDLAFAKRPEFELFDLQRDPAQTKNVAGEVEYAEQRDRLRADLEAWMQATDDPRAQGADDFDSYPYFGGRARKR